MPRETMLRERIVQTNARNREVTMTPILRERYETPHSRRTFLRRTLLGSVALSLAPLIPERAAATLVHRDESGFFSPQEATVLAGIARAFIPSDTEEIPDPVELGVVERIGRLLSRAHPENQDQFRLLLHLFERLPLLFAGTFTPFSAMPAAQKRAYLAGWGESRLAFRRMAFQALKNLVMLTYYSRDEVWATIGYDGPWV
ncbi:MAG: hypothetical protein D6812_04545 [Deltaproteobacteria bacterium]|nr:MAG: hypothetical protein D6812_04545 [Deltaproteobacteria bacterium]